VNAIPILCYHGITTEPSDRVAQFAVTPDDFARHMDLLVERGYKCVTMSEHVDDLRSPQMDRSTRTALITFDDGYLDFATVALPILQERQLASTLYVTTGWLNGGTSEPAVRPDDPFLDWSQLPELVEAGVEIGAHSHTHPQMDTLDAAATIYELTRSKALIEDALQSPVRSFAYPHGYNGRRVRRLTEQAGYDSAAGVRNMLSHPGDDPFGLARLMPERTNTVDDVRNWLDGNAPIAPGFESMRTKGWRMYRRTRAIVTRQPGTDYR
jgi:peptidoglycan/xylan/chitin deacetylase (PgdA/CDA1 family)